MKSVTATRVRDYTFAAVLGSVLAMPIAAHAEGTTAKTTQDVRSTEQVFSALDTDRSGVVSEAEYIVHAQASKNMQAEEATNEFKAMDQNNDDRLTLAELKTGTAAYKRTVQ